MIYTTQKQAVADGYTHEAWFGGVPCWAKDVDTDCLTLAAKLNILDKLLPVLGWIQGFWTDCWEVEMREIDHAD